MLLKIRELVVKYGAVSALQGISLKVDDGRIVALIGANGAGKTSLLNAISGVAKRSGGSITLDGRPVPDAPHKVVEMGIVQVPEGRRVFPSLAVEENLLAGAMTRKDKAGISVSMQEVYQIFPRLLERRNQLAGTLSGGEQQMLAIGRGLMAKPRVLMIDEPSLGLAPLLIRDVMRCIERLNDSGTTVLLVEQNASKALAVCDHAYVLETGKIVMEGEGQALLSDPRIREAYLGEKPEREASSR